MPLLHLDLNRTTQVTPKHFKWLVYYLSREIYRDLLGDMEHAAGGPRGHHLTREPHGVGHSRLARRERRS
ncbi:hypothetical protein OUY22_09535 [Nonomuraea sp. MCN248]|uniref:Uncharacterized protein n=1 Tax=Nonomuraea corallina TaxID=2989783 RepID=A0ABT4S8W2_9ACTN|nr:hypothetical protein [Nonomuraea corallina]MDA0633658.1 hypothetical protein [Nonomuraea corallina]